jgi:nickel/cobalt exporter
MILMEKKDKDIVKLSKLCQHWAEHNESHKDSFIKWRDIAKEKGLDSVVENLNKAIEMMDKSTEYLLATHKELT